jgi:hypothetical protein
MPVKLEFKLEPPGEQPLRRAFVLHKRMVYCILAGYEVYEMGAGCPINVQEVKLWQEMVVKSGQTRSLASK